MKDKTFIMLKPDAKEKGLVTTILNELESKGCVILRQEEVAVTPLLILTHYQEVIDQVDIPNFEDRILREYKDQTVTIAVLSHPTKDVVSYVRQLIGATEPAKADPSSIRGKYADDDYTTSHIENRLVRNLIHASDSKRSANREFQLWFSR
jgi:nucleoside-diphosphate kinase